MHVFIIRNHSEWQNDIGTPNGECEREKLKRVNRSTGEKKSIGTACERVD